ncbi:MULTISPECIES: type VII secretion protein EccB [Streptacidiphilus]|uniref:Type VII secretion protein EccB n=1 Tax=Streptacidiphilus cavernicola TaxID=3342716 RepID=A0ABV6V0V7_9ACTN|nr:type VII secretion protein EccB [Streptacidiphilus jeojiense]
MASRRNELSAYTFSRRRTVAAFLQPSGGGNEEDAPKPRRAVVPGLIVGAVAVAGFGAYGMIKPSAPLHWDTANAVIVDKETTTRYVMMDHELHPVLNIASARLLLTPGSTVEEVDDKVLNSGKVPHAPTVGIPYAPDSLPTAKDAATAKSWVDCERPAAGGQNATDQKLFVLGGPDAAKVSGAGSVGANQALYVRAPSGTYLVDSTGTAHQLAADSGQDELLATVALGATVGQPQVVTKDWLATLRTGDPITVPKADIADFGAAVNFLGHDFHVGDTFRVAEGNSAYLHYVVLHDGVHPMSDFTDGLVQALHPEKTTETVMSAAAVAGANNKGAFEGDKDWPLKSVTQVNTSATGVACSVYTGATTAAGVPVLGLWTGSGYPVDSSSGTAGVYVTPGTGLLFRSVTGTSTTAGPVSLLTDTGLRYPVQLNSDGSSPSAGASAATGSGSTSTGQSGQQQDNAQSRLGYSGITPPPVPEAWTGLLSAGPALTTAAAGQQQGS